MVYMKINQKKFQKPIDYILLSAIIDSVRGQYAPIISYVAAIRAAEGQKVILC